MLISRVLTLWLIIRNIFCSLNQLFYEFNVVFIISCRDAKLVYGCDIEERRRKIRKAHKRRISETSMAAESDYSDCRLAKLQLRKTKV
jgi:hypothetical protein